MSRSRASWNLPAILIACRFDRSWTSLFIEQSVGRRRQFGPSAGNGVLYSPLHINILQVTHLSLPQCSIVFTHFSIRWVIHPEVTPVFLWPKRGSVPIEQPLALVEYALHVLLAWHIFWHSLILMPTVSGYSQSRELSQFLRSEVMFGSAYRLKVSRWNSTVLSSLGQSENGSPRFLMFEFRCCSSIQRCSKRQKSSIS